MWLIKLLQVCEIEPCEPIIHDDPHDDYDKFKETLDKSYNDEFKITWKAAVFGFVVLVLVFCVVIPWLIGALSIFNKLF